MEDIDQLTLELLMNKSTYQKYLSQTNPKRAEENRIYKSNLHKFSNNIMKLTSDYLSNPDEIQVTNEVNEMLDTFGKTWVKYFETKELENPEEYKKSQDEDTLFDESHMEDGNESSSQLKKNPILNKRLNYSMEYYSKH